MDRGDLNDDGALKALQMEATLQLVPKGAGILGGMSTNTLGFVLIGLAVGIAGTAITYWVSDLPKILPLAVGVVLVGVLLARRKPAAPNA